MESERLLSVLLLFRTAVDPAFGPAPEARSLPAFGERVEVVSPEEVRGELARAAEVLKLYGTDGLPRSPSGD
ncbi:hypothetical protein ACWDZ4_08960 [Streptomyces sp. NPDC003016]